MECDESFRDFNLDIRLLNGIADLGWTKPTDVQAVIIREMLKGNNVVVQARTGSGKTGAFSIPLIQGILETKKYDTTCAIRALVLAPSKELCNQTADTLIQLTKKYSFEEVRVQDLSRLDNVEKYRYALRFVPDVIVCTPTKIVQLMEMENLIALNNVTRVVVDEADLIYELGYEKDLKALRHRLPKSFQAALMSATLSVDIKGLKRLLCDKSKWVNVELPEDKFLPDSTRLTQYILEVEVDDKYLVLCALFKFYLLQGKAIIFTNSVDRSYKVKLFLEEFGLKTGILNHKMPIQSRTRTLKSFNCNYFNILLVADQDAKLKTNVMEREVVEGGAAPSAVQPFMEYDSSHGIDFHVVSHVINFDFPLSVKSYIHRVGRTARGDRTGTALSFVSQKEKPFLRRIERFLSRYNNSDFEFKMFAINMSHVEQLRYRVQDVQRKVHPDRIKEYRRKEIAREIVNSQQLKSHFSKNPRDLEALMRLQRGVNIGMTAPLKNVPDYLHPKSLQHIKPKKLAGQKNKRKRKRKSSNILKKIRAK